MKLHKKIVIKLLVGFMIGAVLLTYVSGQVYNSTIPIVTTVKSFSAPLQAKEDAVGKIVYQDTVLITAPVDVIVEKVYVDEGVAVMPQQDLLLFNLVSLQSKKEQLKNEILKTDTNDQSKAVISIQIEIAELSLSLFRANSELEKLINEKNHEVDILSHMEKIEETNLQMQLAEESLRKYQNPLKASNEEQNLIRAVERIKLQLMNPSLTAEQYQALSEQLNLAVIDLQAYRIVPSSSYDISEELNLKLALLQAKNNLLESEKYNGFDDNAAQLKYEAALYEYDQKKIIHEQQLKIDEKKLQLSIAQYKQQLAELLIADNSKKQVEMKNKEIEVSLKQIEAIIKNDGKFCLDKACEVINVNVQQGDMIPANTVMLKLCESGKSTAVQWKMSADDFAVGDEITADLTVYETVKVDNEEKTVEKEKATKLFISKKRFIADEDIFEYTATIPQANLKETSGKAVNLAMSNNQSAKISMNKSKSEEAYETVIPVSAVSFVDEHRGTVFCAVANKQGKLVARKIEVDILDYDKKNAALEKNIKDKIVVFSDRPLKSEGEIREDE